MNALIIGDGIAGITAATWLKRYEAPFEWLTNADAMGGILTTVYNPIIDFPGMRRDSGLEVVDEIRRWADLPERTRASVDEVRAREDGFVVTAGDQIFEASNVLVATGTRRRKLGVEGEEEGLGDWIVMSTAQNPARFDQRRVVIIGGGDAAVEGAVNVVEAGAHSVTVVARSPLRAQRQFVRQFGELENAKHWPEQASPVSFEKLADGGRVHLDSGSHLDADIVVVRIGVQPVMPTIHPKPELDRRGFLLTDGCAETSVPGLFAAGDVTSTPLRSIASSMGDGTRAARTIAERMHIWGPTSAK